MTHRHRERHQLVKSTFGVTTNIVLVFMTRSAMKPVTWMPGSIYLNTNANSLQYKIGNMTLLRCTRLNNFIGLWI